MRLTIRGYGDGVQVFEETVDIEPDERMGAEIAEKHTKRLRMFERHMIEIEFLDHPNPAERFFRFGTDRSGMVMPVEIPARPTVH